jgi:hypothetical protein
MATWSRCEEVTRTVKWVVPASEPWGACWSEVVQAVNQAIAELRAAGRLGEFEEPPDDLIRVKVGDEEAIVFYESKEQ